MASALETVVISILSGVGTGVTGIAFLGLQQRFISNTQQISTTLAEIEELTDRCAIVAGEVWSEIGDPDSNQVTETVCLLQDISTFTGFVTSRVNDSSTRLTSAIVNFRQATSGDNFDVRGRPSDIGRKMEIRSAAVSLKVALREVDFERRRFHLPFISY